MDTKIQRTFAHKAHVHHVIAAMKIAGFVNITVAQVYGNTVLVMGVLK